ncbi:hypothetical protein [Pantoea phage LIMEzero]|uniref:Tail tubular protein B n=1 Tax=Pantoea phage LIMEzero TaxID=943335 RepID=F4N9U5_9CAUD|nr:hypothetical protein LIMEzero_ORF42 [Pantoea phage LIMEzero]CBY88573.1 hypothetical protein [Pantoea phage LIMEzero]
MSTVQGNYPTLLGGVSQQVYTERQVGQVETQVNMTSDTVRGLRKRPGTRLVLDVSGEDTQWSLGNTGHLRQFTADLGWGQTSFVVNTITGTVSAIQEADVMQVLGTKPYLVTSNPSDIVFATVGSELYVGNCDVLPATVTNESRWNPRLGGYFFVLSGAYGKVYSVTVSWGTVSYTASYTTPQASDTDASNQSTGEYIINQLVNSLSSQVSSSVLNLASDGSYLSFRLQSGYDSDDVLLVTTSTGSTYAIASKAHSAKSTDDLPARVPFNDGFIMTVGDTGSYQYFQWLVGESRWQECGKYGSPTGLDPGTMPLKIIASDTENQHEFSAVEWGGREAGDDDNNETPQFLLEDGVGMTGMSAFQGRLIIFSGPYISMSSNVRAYRTYFYRTTVTQVLDGDRIEFTSTSFSGASFRYGVPFNSDLILASETHQGVIPGRNQVLTPNNATAVLTSAYQMNTDVSPLVCGRSLYYSYPRSTSSFAIKELTPSGYTDLQYVSQDVTDHIPTYLEGAASYICSSTTNNIVVIGSTTELNTLYVNEYMWSADSKVQSSWHKWTFNGTIHCAWFVRENLLLLIEQDNAMHLVYLSMRDVPNPEDANRYLPATDFNLTLDVTNPTGNAPYIQFASTGVQAQLWDLMTASGLDAFAAVTTTGPYIGAEVGLKSLEPATRRLHLYATYGERTLHVGQRFTAQFSPTPPIITDSNGGYVDVPKLMIQAFNLIVRYTSPFKITAGDDAGLVYDGLDSSAIDFQSEELNLNQATLTKRHKIRARMGTNSETSETLFESNTPGDFNLLTLGYILKFNNRIRRM